MTELTIKHTARGPADILELSGDLDVYTAARFRETVLKLAVSGRHRLVADLEQVSFMDNTGLGVIVGALKRCTGNGGAFALVCTGEAILRVIRVTGLTGVLDVRGTADEALALVAEDEREVSGD